METTNRTDLGANLLSPQEDEAGNRNNAGYLLVTIVNDGDVVLHWDTSVKALVGWSRAVGGRWEDRIVWASVPGKGVPYDRPAWVRGLEGPYYFPESIGLRELQAVGQHIARIHAELRSTHGDPLYFPFTKYANTWNLLRAGQPYMSKFPAALVDVVPRLARYLEPAITTSPGERVIERRPRTDGVSDDWEYIPVPEDVHISSYEPYAADPAMVERGLSGHRTTQNALAARLVRRGFTPLRPGPTDPLFDLAWRDGDLYYVCEVKSTTDTNEEAQLRLGLGQVLRYRHQLASGDATVIAVLAPERRPTDAAWEVLCADLDVRLVWPPDFDGL